ncbi:HAD-IB family phosphatase [Legionella sp. CNM-4043-24]|uniref:HAD-IB family phosphatase n=1 Tax=Legionella sp. CNM-4043-24 TaxID=3421646 RepID=UPI00403B3686
MSDNPSWRPKQAFDVFFFDCDSTITQIEGLDELAELNGVGAETRAISQRCMDRTGLNPEVYKKRLDLVRPDKQQMTVLAQLYLQAISPDVQDTLNVLRRLGKRIYILSGGIKETIIPLALSLGMTENQVLAVDLYFDEQGGYRGFDSSSYLVQSQGKNRQIATIVPDTQRAFLMGDGFSDWEAHASVGRFAGYGGAQNRPWIREHSSFYIETASFLPVLNLGLTEAEVSLLLPQEQVLYQLGASMIQQGQVLIKNS